MRTLDMQLKGCILCFSVDQVFKALADASRRQLLDRLHAANGQTLSELCEHLDMTRQAVTKHLALLETANLVVTVWRGREKLHYLNPVPIHEISERWIRKFERTRLRALNDLKKRLEENMMENKPQFVYVTYIATTPKKLWAALTEAEFTQQYWFGRWVESDWRQGSAVIYWTDASRSKLDITGKVLRCNPPRLLSYTFTDCLTGEANRERSSRVTFEIEPMDSVVKLTLTHDDFDPGSTVLEGVSRGWPGILSSLKSLLESGQAMVLDVAHFE